MNANLDELDPKARAILKRVRKRDRRVEGIFRRTLHYLEEAVALITILALVVALCEEIISMCTNPGYFSDLTHFLHNVLTIVVGLEFARMIIDTTPATILEVLTVAITRHVILSHDDPWSNLACVICIAGLFATRRFLVREHELKEELVEVE